MEEQSDFLSNNINIEHIYTRLSIVENEDNFEFNEKKDLLIIDIEKIFNKNFLIIETSILQNNIELLNSSFVKLIKYCFEKNEKNVGFIFICYIDYFNLDPNITYISFHEKIQNLIKNSFIKLVGKKVYEKYIKREQQEKPVIHTLFDLIKNK